MREIFRILDALSVAAAAEPNATAALVFLARKRGSGYRQAGARLLVFADGSSVGLLSGGCVEDHARQEALLQLEGLTPRTLVVDTTAVEEAFLGHGTGCAGVLDVLIEPFSIADLERPDTALGFLAGLRREPRRAALATVWEARGRFSPMLARHLWRDLQGAFGTDIGDAELRQAVDEQVLDVLVTDHGSQGSGASTVVQGAIAGEAHSASWAVEVLEPPPRLWIFGAGEDVVPLVALARGLDWETVVVAPRLREEHRRRFADGAKRQGPSEPNLKLIEIPPREAAIQLALRLLPERRTELIVLATHNLLADVDYLRGLIPLQPRYLGAIASPKRRELLVDLLRRSGFTDSDLELLDAPAGVDLGGARRTEPEDVALSVVAQIQGRLSS